VKEFDRHNKLKEFLISNEFIYKEDHHHHFQKYSIKSEDIYLIALANLIRDEVPSFLKLKEVFVEVFIKTRISLKELEIKETIYGKEIRRIMGE
jgi:hypothetical protein